MGDWWIDESPPVGPREGEEAPSYRYVWLGNPSGIASKLVISKAQAEQLRAYLSAIDMEQFEVYHHIDPVKAEPKPIEPPPPNRDKGRINNTGPRHISSFDHRGRRRY